MIAVSPMVDGASSFVRFDDEVAGEDIVVGVGDEDEVGADS